MSCLLSLSPGLDFRSKILSEMSAFIVSFFFFYHNEFMQLSIWQIRSWFHHILETCLMVARAYLIC